MNIHTVAKVLRQMDIKVVDVRTRASQLYIPCPLAPWTHPNRKDHSNGFSISIRPLDNSPCRCWNGKCGFAGNIFSLAKQFSILSGNRIDVSDLGFTIEDVLCSFDEPVVDDEWKEGLVPFNGTYRFLTPELSHRFGVMYHSKHHRIVFPIYNKTGTELIGGVGRATDKTWHKPQAKYYNYGHFQKHYHLFMQHEQQHEDCILTEGPMDCLSVKRCDMPYDVFGVLGASLSADQADFIKCYRRVVLLFDNDHMRLPAIASAAQNLFPECSILIPTHILSTKDPGDASIDELLTTMKKLVPVKLDLR